MRNQLNIENQKKKFHIHNIKIEQQIENEHFIFLKIILLIKKI